MTRSPSGKASAGGDRTHASMRGERYESFVVRVLVRESGETGPGQVTHVASGQRLHFTEPDQLPDLIRRQLALANVSACVPGPDPP
jgi:hypothetical protein